MQYYDRLCKVIIENANQIEIVGSKIKFEITKSSANKENTGKIEIYNLSPSTRKLITAENSLVKLYAGYKEYKGLIEIGQGDISKVATNKSKTDIVTEIYISEGLRKIRGVPVSISYGSKTKVTLKNILSDITAKSKGAFNFRMLDLDNSLKTDNGYSDVGSLDQILDNLALHFDFTWSVQNGVFILKGNKARRQDEVMLLTPESGLILHPENVKKLSRRLDKSKLPKQDINRRYAQSLLQPHLQIHDIIAIESLDLSGKFKIAKVIHNGDSRGNDWYSDLELVPLE